jgi:HEAT repeat protein
MLAISLAQLRSSNPTERREAVEELGKLGDPTAGDTLIAALADPDMAVRLCAVIALGRLAFQPAAPALLALLDTSRGRLRSLIIDTLSDLRITHAAEQAVAAYIQHLADPDEHIEHHQCYECEIIVPALERFGTALVPPLLAAIHQQKRPHGDLLTLLALTGDPEAYAPLVALVEYPKQPLDLRSDAIAALGTLGDARAITPLRHLLDQSQTAQELQVEALVALADMATPAVIAYFTAILHDPQQPLWKRRVVTSFASAPVCSELREAVVPLLTNAEPELAAQAAIALADAQDRRGLPVLLALTTAPEAHQRKRGISALGQLGDPHALPRLEALAAGDPDREVQRVAQQAIAKLRKGSF